MEEKAVFRGVSHITGTLCSDRRANNASKILKDLKQNGLSGIKVTAGELLSMPGERILCGTVEELSEISLTALRFFCLRMRIVYTGICL